MDSFLFLHQTFTFPSLSIANFKALRILLLAAGFSSSLSYQLPSFVLYSLQELGSFSAECLKKAGLADLNDKLKELDGK